MQVLSFSLRQQGTMQQDSRVAGRQSGSPSCSWAAEKSFWVFHRSRGVIMSCVWGSNIYVWCQLWTRRFWRFPAPEVFGISCLPALLPACLGREKLVSNPLWVCSGRGLLCGRWQILPLIKSETAHPVNIYSPCVSLSGSTKTTANCT